MKSISYKERHIVAELRCFGLQIKRITRRYSKIDNAMPKVVQLAMMYGKIGDVVEVYHDITGSQLGHVKIRASGVLDVYWSWRDDDVAYQNS